MDYCGLKDQNCA